MVSIKKQAILGGLGLISGANPKTSQPANPGLSLGIHETAF